ncbi:DUF6612 family protein [Sporomusa sp. KB1]|jgi:hypothetical protein|uniref:DUF6612 family protein n=1 Tax=Sporomusa sp. KB1 TaxID=943346 RepID=UPI0011A282FD|nr:DUF6612 family protein [Sporomusa sp. KB1]TWH44933.1 hypothetical protein Salpa_0812 [Sporomusa sp. KB1]
MSRTKFLAKIIMVYLMTMLFSVCSIGNAMAAINDDHKELVVQAYEKLFALKSYHMTLETTGSMSFLGQTMNMVMNGECDTQVKPMVAKNVMTITVGDASAKNEQKIVQYIEEAKGQFAIYSNMNGCWEKQYMPQYNPLDEYASYSKAITSVIPVEENAEVAVFAVTMDGSYLKENLEQAMNSTNMKKVSFSDELFKNLGDITYQVTINKETATIVKSVIDMSGILAAIGNNIANDKAVPAEQKSIIQGVFSNTRLVTTVVFSKFNSVDKIVIPNEVKVNSLPTKLI